MALTDGISSYWKLDESSGNAADSVGSTTLTNNNSIAYSPGKINNGADLVAASSMYFQNASKNVTAAFTISFWLSTVRAATNQDMIFDAGTGTGSGRVLIQYVGDSKIHYSNFSTEIVQSTTLPSGTWTMVTVTNDGSGNGTVYINAASQATGTVSHSSTTSTFTIGRRNDTANTYFGGSLDEIGLWTRALSGPEISELYNSGAGLQYPFDQPQSASGLSLLGVG